MKLSLLSVAVIAVLLPLGHSGAVIQQQPCPTSLADCPREGCGAGDPELNKQKNRTEAPETVTVMTLSRIRSWNEPSSWPKGKERSSLAFRENKAVIVKGFLRDARVSGRETTNCKLSGEQNNDFHLDLISFRDAPKATAVTAEITPRVRRTGWDFDKLNFLGEEKYYVRISGWLMLDTAHIGNPIVRSTNWEIHPVTMFEVCTKTKPKCDQEQGWVLLEDFEIP